MSETKEPSESSSLVTMATAMSTQPDESKNESHFGGHNSQGLNGVKVDEQPSPAVQQVYPQLQQQAGPIQSSSTTNQSQVTF